MSDVFGPKLERMRKGKVLREYFKVSYYSKGRGSQGKVPKLKQKQHLEIRSCLLKKKVKTINSSSNSSLSSLIECCTIQREKRQVLPDLYVSVGQFLLKYFIFCHIYKPSFVEVFNPFLCQGSHWQSGKTC